MESLTFMMGEFAAEFPTDRLYAKNHMWALQIETAQPDVTRFGFTAYAVRLLQDVYFLDWYFDAPAQVTARQEMGTVESKKAESSLYVPLGGELTQFNPQLLADPSGINVDKYGDGWLFDIQCDLLEHETLMSAEHYLQHLEQVWKITQQTIKGQLN